MANGFIVDSEVARWFDLFRGAALWAGAHTEVPSLGDPGASEVFDAGYSRQALYWISPTPRELTTSTALTFATMSSLSVMAVGLWTAQVGGELRGYCTPDPEDIIVVDDPMTVIIPIGEVSIRML